MSILEIIGMGINNEQTSWSPVHTTQQLGIYPITWGLYSLTTSPQSSGPQYCIHSIPENSLAMSLPSGKEETEFLWHTWAKATLQMFTRGGSPCCFAASRNAWALLFLGASPSLVLFKWNSS